MGSADKSNGAHSVATGVHRALRSLDKARRIGQSQVVVGTKIKGFSAVAQGDFGALLGAYYAFLLVETVFTDLFEFAGEMFLKFAVHNILFV